MERQIYYVGVNNAPPDKELGQYSKIIRQSELDDPAYVYSKCPVHTHKQERTFVVLSPIHFDLKVNRTSEGCGIECSNHRLLDELDENHIRSPRPVIQVKMPKFLFWTSDDDIWFEFNDHPMTSLNNNLVAVPGWFNLSNWTRSTSFAFTIVDEKKPVTIKRGDPIYRIAFHSTDPNDKFTLVPELDIEKASKIKKEFTEMFIQGRTDGSWKPKVFSKTTTEKKCPLGHT